METSTSAAAPTPAIDFGDDGEYRPGACNIGQAEIAVRRRFGIAGVMAAGVLAVGLVAVGAPRASRLLVALPLAAGAVGLLQARLGFCAAYGMSGVRNFSNLGQTTAVEDTTARGADRQRSLRIIGGGAARGAAGGVLLALLPV